MCPCGGEVRAFTQGDSGETHEGLTDKEVHEYDSGEWRGHQGGQETSVKHGVSCFMWVLGTNPAFSGRTVFQFAVLLLLLQQ